MASQTVLKRCVKIFICVVATLCLGGCVTYFGYDGPYEGRVIDKDTNQPIEGAVVHGSWYRAHPGPGGATHTYYDSREVLTDKEGKFKIEGVGLLIMSNMEEMYVYVLKAGYPQIYGTWEGFKNNRTNVEWVEGKPILKLKRMTLEERRKNGPTQPDGPAKKQRLWRIESNKEMIETGRPADTLLRVE